MCTLPVALAYLIDSKPLEQSLRKALLLQFQRTIPVQLHRSELYHVIERGHTRQPDHNEATPKSPYLWTQQPQHQEAGFVTDELLMEKFVQVMQLPLPVSAERKQAAAQKSHVLKWQILWALWCVHLPRSSMVHERQQQQQKTATT
jgi:hypothetical protein